MKAHGRSPKYGGRQAAKGGKGRRGTFKARLLWGRPADGGGKLQKAQEGPDAAYQKAAKGAPFKARLLPNAAFWTQRKTLGARQISTALGGRQTAKGAGGPGCQKAAKGAGAGYCLMCFWTWQMAKVRCWAAGKLQKAKEDRDAAHQKAHLKPGYCLMLLFEAGRNSLKAPGRSSCKSRGPGCCLPKGCQGRRGTFKARRRRTDAAHQKLQRNRKELAPTGRGRRQAAVPETTIFLWRAPASLAVNV